ncbi:elongation factor P maturation arginine rhamnosyltransferase EarP [uncultured Aquabacterium sp.]|jgi:uncharacterized repeat protein (TIGR03837 family)|uniref:elongation factor P maturation arginine rhamnosyltransferase EarP n=1 Tax=uncultured Aquabacterium sp. TaxID=158753 RepID=UPI002623B641|nr:elongation factor P maturation arginine rhamnosyltransferase EarP [uncultured Aquabacterium sp.]
MLWDVFCQVIDNFGDIGVCWRLTRDLAARGHTVRLWVDDASALQWMAPDVRWATRGVHRVGTLGAITVHPWSAATVADDVPEPGDVVIEAFGCNPPEAFLARMARPAPPRWINLEYLSAEDYVERSHGLQSPVWSGPAAGLVKHFFYPGFAARTGGLLREPGLIAAQDAIREDAALSAATLTDLRIPHQPGERLASVFCYAHAPLASWLDALAAEPVPTRVLLTPGHATRLGEAWAHARTAAGTPPAPHLHLTPLAALSQPDFDRLLACCDLNLVRGEDSAVRALWAGRPHVWHIYEQDDGVHAAKLDAFMARWMACWPAPLARDVSAWWRAWNGLAPWPDALPAWPDPTGWGAATLHARAALQAEPDLVTQLIAFVTRSG